jgi:hypothetical protein
MIPRAQRDDSTVRRAFGSSPSPPNLEGRGNLAQPGIPDVALSEHQAPATAAQTRVHACLRRQSRYLCLVERAKGQQKQRATLRAQVFSSFAWS